MERGAGRGLERRREKKREEKGEREEREEQEERGGGREADLGVPENVRLRVASLCGSAKDLVEVEDLLPLRQLDDHRELPVSLHGLATAAVPLRLGEGADTHVDADAALGSSRFQGFKVSRFQGLRGGDEDMGETGRRGEEGKRRRGG